MSNDRSLRIYLLAVCFVAIVCGAITLGMALYGLLKIAIPEITLDTHSFNAHQSLDDFRRSHFNPAKTRPAPLFFAGGNTAHAIAFDPAGRVNNPAPDPDFKPVSDQELENLRQESLQRILSDHQRGALQDLIRLSMVMLVSAVMFFTHWRLARRHSGAG